MATRSSLLRPAIYDIDVVFSVCLLHGLSHSQHSLSKYETLSVFCRCSLSKVRLAQFARFVDRRQHLGALGDHRHHRRRHALPRQQPHRAARGARGERVRDAGGCGSGVVVVVGVVRSSFGLLTSFKQGAWQVGAVGGWG